VDSTGVVALMARHSKSPVLTNTIGFGRKGYDETDAARESSLAFGTDHAELQVRPDAVEALRKLAWYYDEPFADSSMVPTYYVCQMARRRVVVALSGDGGDESFAGYRRYYFDRLENRVRAAVPGWIRRPAFGLLAAAYPQADWMPQRLRAKTLLRNLSFDAVKGYFTSMSHFQPAMKRALLSPDLLAALGDYDSLSVFREHWDNSGSADPLSRIQYLDVKTYLVDDILTKVDRASMAVSMEVRVPLIDKDFMQMAASLPPGWKLRGRTSKYVLKRALAKVVPPSVFTRPKSGFSMPLKDWLRGDLKGMAQDLLFSDGGIGSSGLFRRPYLERLWKEHASGFKDHSFPLFSLLSFGLWHDRFMKGAPR
jgi:asparagine synthase (glutamine-hydrolysing)